MSQAAEYARQMAQATKGMPATRKQYLAESIRRRGAELGLRSKTVENAVSEAGKRADREWGRS